MCQLYTNCNSSQIHLESRDLLKASSSFNQKQAQYHLATKSVGVTQLLQPELARKLLLIAMIFQCAFQQALLQKVIVTLPPLGNVCMFLSLMNVRKKIEHEFKRIIGFLLFSCTKRYQQIYFLHRRCKKETFKGNCLINLIGVWLF